MESLLNIKIQHENGFVRLNVADYRNNPSSPDVSQFFLSKKNGPDEVCEAVFKFIDTSFMED